MSLFDYGLNQIIDILPKLGSRQRFLHRSRHRRVGVSSRTSEPAEYRENSRVFAEAPTEDQFVVVAGKEDCQCVTMTSSSDFENAANLRVINQSDGHGDLDDEDDFVTPLHSGLVSRRGLLEHVSRTSSLYLSASDIAACESLLEPSQSSPEVINQQQLRFMTSCNGGRMDDLRLMNNEALPSAQLEDNHELICSGRTLPLPCFTLRDGNRSIDFVLVWREPDVSSAPASTPTHLQQQKEKIDLQHRHARRRKVFEENLSKEGIILEEDRVTDLPLRFVKLHLPIEVCCRYAEILKLRMPMREKLDECFLKRRLVLHFPGLPSIEITAPALLQDVTDGISKMFNFVRNNPTHFPPCDRHFTAVYSRDRKYLFNMHCDFFSGAERARIVDFVLRRKKFCEDDEGDEFAFGIEKLISDGTYDAAYPIHEGDFEAGNNSRAMLYKHWASVRNFYKYQPLDHIKKYFGVKIALYFAWLGFYTYMLIPASVIGFLCFLYAISTINQHKPSNDICNHEIGEQIEMCPLCDSFCDYWNLDDTCFHAKFTYLVDNPATVFFAVFMSFWAALFLEMWKRYSAEISHRWDLTGFDIQEEHPRPQYLARLAHIEKKTVNIVTKTIEPRPPFWSMRVPGVLLSASSVLLLVLMAFVAVVAVILYRMSVLAALSIHGDTVITSYAIIFTSTTAALINLVCIMIFNQLYARMAEYLTERELQRTQTEFDDSLTLKIYLLQFINYYASIFYIAFFKGKLVGYPGDYNRFFGSRQEECSPGGCLLELSVQLAIIMVGKQAMNTVVEMVLPKIWQWYNMLTVPRSTREAHVSWPQWAKDFKLIDFDPRGLFPEYLEMVLQYGFVTIFVSSFPLAPLFAFMNNILEIRLDGKKLLTNYRRPVPQRVKDIGVWFRILDSIGKFAVITNAFIIAFTSNFIPELVYKHVISEDQSLTGFLNHSLAIFNVDDYPPEYRPQSSLNVTVCRYPDYRNPPGGANEYKYAPIFWHIVAARLAFVVVFENVVAVVILLVKWLIPDTPHRLKEQIRREAYLTNELIVEQELKIARGEATLSQQHCDDEEEQDELGLSTRSQLRRQFSEPIVQIRRTGKVSGSKTDPVDVKQV